MLKFRGLKPEEIDVRVGSVTEKGASLLLYKDARVDMAVLDETVGEENWQRDHKEVKGNLFCGIGIWSEAKKEWIWKWDCGTESYTEKEKGESSDSFKRAGFAWGIGRELYTSPFIFVECKTKKTEYNGKTIYKLEDYSVNNLKVLDIQYEEGEYTRTIKSVVICDKYGNVVYPKKSQAPAKKTPQKIGDSGIDYLQTLIMEVGAEVKPLLDYYKVNSLEDMTIDQYKHCVAVLEKRRTDG